MTYGKLFASAIIATSLIGSTLAASAQAGGASGAGAATIPGNEVTAGERGRTNMQPGMTTGSAATRNAVRSESQYVNGDRKGSRMGEKPDASEVAPAGR